MRKFLLAIINMLFIVDAYAQTDALKLPIINGQVLYTGVVQTPNVTAKTLHKNSQLWIATTFKKAEIITDSQKKGIITIKANTYVPYLIDIPNPVAGYNVEFKILLQLKDNKYKFAITNFYLSTVPNGTYAFPAVTMDLERMIKTMESNKQLKHNMKMQAIVTKSFASTVVTLNKLHFQMLALVNQLNYNILKANANFYR